MPKENFSADEWKELSDAWITVVSATMSADATLSSEILETIAMNTIAIECKEKYASNALVEALFAEPLTALQFNPHEHYVKGLERVGALLAKAPEAEAEEFKQFLLFSARKVAKASGEELFGSGTSTSAKEAEFLSKLPSILKMKTTPGIEGVFSLRGRLRSTDGAPAAKLGVAIVDEDAMDADDLLALGHTDDDGGFHCSFLASEFQQDALEFEETPDVKLHVVKEVGGIPRAIFHKSFPDLDWSKGSVNLGDVVLEGVDLANPKALEGVEAIPGLEKRAARLSIDHELVRYCFAEVAPLVERLTGWSNLLDGLKIELATSTSSYTLREALVGAGQDPTGIAADLMAFTTDLLGGAGAGAALYDPHIHTVVINTSIMEQTNLDAFKVLLGHELVHVGQFKYTPGLKEYNLAHLRGMIVNAQNNKLEETTKREPYMFELEGYAKYIESDFLQKRYYPMALLIYNPSITEQLLLAVLAKLVPPAPGDEKNNKAAQYFDGRERYRQRQVGDVPAKFQLDVSKLYRAGEPLLELPSAMNS